MPTKLFTLPRFASRMFSRVLVKTSSFSAVTLLGLVTKLVTKLVAKLVAPLVVSLVTFALLFCSVLDTARAQPYLYRADGVRGAQLFSDLSFLLGLEVSNEGSGLTQRTLVGEFSGNDRRLFLNDLARVGGFAWAANKSKLTLSSSSRLLTRSYSFSSGEEYASFRSRLRSASIEAGPLIIRQMRGSLNPTASEVELSAKDSSKDASKDGGLNSTSRARSSGSTSSNTSSSISVSNSSVVVYDIQAIEAFHDSAESIYAELSGEDHNRLISPSNSVIYPVVGERFALMIFRLQYAWAEDTRTGGEGGKLLPGVAGLMSQVLAARYGGSAPRATEASSDSSLNNLLSGGLEKINELGISTKGGTVINGSSGSSGSAGNKGSKSGVSLELLPGVTVSSDSSDGGTPLIFADPRQNAVVIYDDRDRYSYYQRLIGELDSRTRLVKIEAAIIDISKSKVRDLGIQWQGEYAGNQASFGDLAEGAAAGALSYATGGFSLSNNAIVSNVNGLISRINLLESQGRGRIVSRPSILTLDNIEASLSSSEKFFVRVEAFQDSSLYPVEVSTKLRVTPHIIREGKQTRIKLLVVIDDGSIDQSTSGNVDGLPRITTNHLTTQAEILETQALVVGGHIRSELSVRKRRVPILGYIPILGLPFSHKTKERRELVRLYIIRPRLTLPADEMAGDTRALIAEEDLLAYPKLLSRDRDRALKAERKREAREAKRAKREAKKAAKREAKEEAERVKADKKAKEKSGEER